MTAALIEECDTTVLVQWRAKNLGYAADVVEAYQQRIAELERLLSETRIAYQLASNRAKL